MTRALFLIISISKCGVEPQRLAWQCSMPSSSQCCWTEATASPKSFMMRTRHKPVPKRVRIREPDISMIVAATHDRAVQSALFSVLDLGELDNGTW